MSPTPTPAVSHLHPALRRSILGHQRWRRLACNWGHDVEACVIMAPPRREVQCPIRQPSATRRPPLSPPRPRPRAQTKTRRHCLLCFVCFLTTETYIQTIFSSFIVSLFVVILFTVAVTLRFEIFDNRKCLQTRKSQICLATTQATPIDFCLNRSSLWRGRALFCHEGVR